jgi:DNA-directed RNA polymerase alpha subunit
VSEDWVEAAAVREYWKTEHCFSTRTATCLANADIRAIEDFEKWPEQDLLCIPNFGRKSLNEIKEVLAYLGKCLPRPRREMTQWEVMASRRLVSFGWTCIPPQ